MATEERDDEALIVAIARGERDALAALYDRHARIASALALRILADAREVEDLVHDVFLEAWQRAGEFDPARGSVKTWLLVRVRSRALDRRKSPAVARRAPLPEGREVAVAADADAVLDGARLHVALAALPPEQRDVLVLGYFDGLSATEIAEKLAIPVGTVKSRVHAAVQKLRERLADDPPG